MTFTIEGADEYIRNSCVDVEDWTDSDTERKTRLLNVAHRTLTKRYPKFVIPDKAVYCFANVLAIQYNDTNKLGQQGVQSMSISGVASFTFEYGIGKNKSLMALITQEVLDEISEANGGISLRFRRIGRSAL